MTIKIADSLYGLAPTCISLFRRIEKEMNENELFQAEFDADPGGCDTRYAGGCATLYSRVIARMMNIPNGEAFYAAAEKFIDETREWHEQHRWRFEPHPDFLKRIKELAKYN